ncbi:MAG: hypothetical protein AB7K09_10145 [Planctomycetota bacterium]
MRRKIIALLLAVAFTVGTTGCFSFVDWTHNKRHLQAWGNKLRDFHKSFDRLFLDYDWDDPTLEYDDGYGT